jgi:hypothetical protein
VVLVVVPPELTTSEPPELTTMFVALPPDNTVRVSPLLRVILLTG